jgi:hypothetical protein
MRTISEDEDREEMGKVISPFTFKEMFSFLGSFSYVKIAVTQFTIIALVLTSVFGGGIATSLAEESLPGDTLYPVKLILEQAKVSFTSGEGNKAKLQSQFAEKRLNEVKKVVKEAPRPRKTGNGKLKQAIQNFQKEVKAVETHLEKAKTEASALAAVEAAKEVSEKVKDLGETLDQTKKDLPPDPEVKQEVQKAEAAMAETDTKAMEVLVSKHEEAGTISQKEVTALLQDKITVAEEKLVQAATLSDALKINASSKSSPSKEEVSEEKVSENLAVNSGGAGAQPNPEVSTSPIAPGSTLTPETNNTDSSAAVFNAVNADAHSPSSVSDIPAPNNAASAAPATSALSAAVPAPSDVQPLVAPLTSPLTPSSLSQAKEKLAEAKKDLAFQNLSQALEKTVAAEKIIQQVPETPVANSSEKPTSAQTQATSTILPVAPSAPTASSPAPTSSTPVIPVVAPANPVAPAEQLK